MVIYFGHQTQKQGSIRSLVFYRVVEAPTPTILEEQAPPLRSKIILGEYMI